MHADGGTGILGALANASSLEETKATWVWFFALKKKKKKIKANPHALLEQFSLQ